MKKTIITLVLLVACSTMSFGRLKVYTCPDGTTKFYVPIFENNGHGGSSWLSKGPAEREATGLGEHSIILHYDYKHGDKKSELEFCDKADNYYYPLMCQMRDAELRRLYDENVERLKRENNYYIPWEEFYKRIKNYVNVNVYSVVDSNTGYIMAGDIVWEVDYGRIMRYNGDEKNSKGYYKKWVDCGDNAWLLCYLRDRDYQEKYFSEGKPLIYQ